MPENRSRSQTRVRIAPSPTGALHIGTSRTALFNYLFAKKYRGKFILRIEDTDLERSDVKWEKDIFEGLKWLGIKWDEFYKQSERIEIYRKYIRRLLDEGRAFWCYHSEKELAEEKERQIKAKEAQRHACSHKSEIRNPKSETNSKSKIQNSKQNPSSKFQIPSSKKGIIRLDTLKKIVKFNDLIRGEIEFDATLLGDISIAKDEKTPLYNFAVVIDDYEMKISHVIRGEDHISNTPKQILIQEAFGFPKPEYAHLPLILGPDRSKLSKRHAAVSVIDYRQEGYLSEALVNFMALLGWNSGDNREIFSIKELVKEFSLEKIQKSGAIFNIDKLDWINGCYIRKKPVRELTELILKEDFFQIPNSKFQIPNNYIKKIIALEQSRLKKLSEIRERTEYFFRTPVYNKEILRWKEMDDQEIVNSLKCSKEIISNFQFPISKQKIEEIFLKEAAKFRDRGELLWPLRAALSGKKASPGPFEISAILGKKEVSRRLSNAIKILEK